MDADQKCNKMAPIGRLQWYFKTEMLEDQHWWIVVYFNADYPYMEMRWRAINVQQLYDHQHFCPDFVSISNKYLLTDLDFSSPMEGKRQSHWPLHSSLPRRLIYVRLIAKRRKCAYFTPFFIPYI
jgi:hypothetical protein